MLLRALIVLLLVLNLGVAAWWWQRDPAPAATRAAVAPGVAPLRLLGEAQPRTAVKPALAQAAAAAVPAAADTTASVAAN
ncbi:hypothetical protein LVB77_19315 [Lysobacter sp. 5GHs7-4]|uniref:hypothetical protein n=1 Tax=Lysobacter sp. 5GHs7-4 TaxID=2904253 RepID=UPI001E49F690|nr:hypothetical protein [Lysobacter sp. 5GHs7-4]UHQ22770.1 hypothetical protein LVB77_19315 [Lysobacter sp. 5GHs7-4]